MSRFAEALQRAQTPSSDRAPDRAERRANRFFVPPRRHAHLGEPLRRGSAPPPRPDDAAPLPEPPPAGGAAAVFAGWQRDDSPERRRAHDQYNRLAAALHEAQRERGIGVVLVASAAPGEGKSMTAAHVALALSESCRRRVLVIDADLRRPSLHGLFAVPNQGGLAESLIGGPLRTARATGRLSLLTAGRVDGDPLQTLTSDAMRTVVERARQQFDWVIVDTPPVALMPDARLLAAMADGVLLVARAGATRYALVQRAADMLGRERILGVVLNAASEAAVTESYGAAEYAAEYGDDNR